MKRNKLICLSGFLAAVGLFFLLGLNRYLTLECLKTNLQLLRLYYAEHALLMVLTFMLIYLVQTALALPGAAIMSLLAGAVFGVLPGTVYSVSAATLGAAISFLATRYLLRDAVMNSFGNRLEAINLELGERGLNYLLFLRLVPLFPFFLVNLAAGLTRLPLRVFFIGTLIGIIPGGFVYVNAGASLATIDSLSGIASPHVLGAFALLGLFALIPVWYNKVPQ